MLVILLVEVCWAIAQADVFSLLQKPDTEAVIKYVVPKRAEKMSDSDESSIG